MNEKRFMGLHIDGALIPCLNKFIYFNKSANT